MTDDLRALLERAAQDVPAPDLAEKAWAAAQSARRRHRALVTAAVAAATVVGVVAWSASDRAPVRADPATSITTVATFATATDPSARPVATVRGAAAYPAVAPTLEATLPWLADSPMPRSLGFAPEDALPRASAGLPVGARAEAVLVRRVPGGYHPVVWLSRPTPGYLELDTVPLVPFLADTNDPYLPLGTRVIDRSGTRLAFLQPGEVVVADLGSGTVQRVPVPVRDATVGGWLADGRTLIVAGTSAWRVDPSTRQVEQVTARSSAYPHQLLPDAPDETASTIQLRTHAADGTALDLRTVSVAAVGVWGDTVTSPDGQWAVSGSWLAPQSEVEGYQGLLAVRTSGDPQPRLLVPPEEGSVKGCCSALGWASSTIVLYASRSVAGANLLAWDVTSGRQWQVAALPKGLLPDGELDTRPGSATTAVSLRQG